jgi:iron(III) transport system permease protein
VAVYNLYETGYTEPVAALAMVNIAIISLALLAANWLATGRAARPAGDRDARAGASA